MKACIGIVLAAALLVVVVANLDRERGQQASLDYVGREDATFSWREYGRTTVGDSELIELRLQSQTWRDIVWQHRLFVIRPPKLAVPDRALLVLGGGRWRPEYDDVPIPYRVPDDAGLFVNIAERMETLVVVLAQVPYQPLFGLTEDQLIAHTMVQYLASGDADWPLLLPMVKSAVRAMDTAEQLVLSEWGVGLEGFTVMGGSKRGWTAWLTAAADPRVSAVVPIVIDALNMAEHFPHQTRAWGAPSVEIRPYTERNLHVTLSEDSGRALREIVDPFAYRGRLRQPKLIVNASNDEYFPVDSVNLYWDALEGEKYLLMLPNERHSVEDYRRLIPTLDVLHRASSSAASMPKVEWEYRVSAAELLLCLRGAPAVSEVLIWSAESTDRDFRDENWHAEVLPVDGDVFRFRQAQPESGYVALYGEFRFSRGDGDAFSLSTTPAVLGDDLGAVAPPLSQGQVCH